MCGICGIIGKKDINLLNRMEDSIFHRGPDSSGSLHFDNVSIGARRLSIIDLKNGDQPLHNEDKQVWVVQNGEIYNYKELRKYLIEKGHKFYSNSDTEVIAHSYEEFGEKCPEKFNGIFAFAIWDKKQNKLFCARDRVGIKPFYYHQNGHVLLFASEIKCILQYDGFKREIDTTSFYNYLGRLFVPGKRTIFKGVNKLLPGHILTFQNGNLKTAPYWDLNLNKKVKCSQEEYKGNIISKLENAVKSQLVSDVPVGAFLSGGIDSNSVVAFMSKHLDLPVQTFTMGYTGDETDLTNELEYARESSAYYKTQHREFIVNPEDILKDLPKIIWHFDEPYAGSLPQYQLSELAGKYVKVILCGSGGDEIFGDYGRGIRLAEDFNSISTIFLHSPTFIKNQILRFNSYLPDIFKRNGLYSYFYNYMIKTFEIGNHYVQQQSIFSEKAKKEILKPEILEQIDIKDTLVAMFYRFLKETRINTIEDIVMYSDFKTQLVDEYLKYTDTLSMAHSVEARVPFLDHELIEYVATIPQKDMVKGNDNKYLLKQAVKDILPPGATDRRKGYFSLPYGNWLRNELKGFVAEVISKPRINKIDLFSYDKVNEVVNAQLAGDNTKTYQAWNLLMFVLWHEMFIENKVSSIAEVDKWKTNAIPALKN